MVGGQVDYMCADVALSISSVTGLTNKAFAVGTAERNPMLPNVPTSNEAGLPEFQASAWNGLFAPKGNEPTPVTVSGRPGGHGKTHRVDPPARGWLAKVFHVRELGEKKPRRSGAKVLHQ
jgi:hypothetical protein